MRRLRSSHESGICDQLRLFHFPQQVFRLHSRWQKVVLEPFNRLIEGVHLMASKYEGFWRAMDTLRDRLVLEEMLEGGEMPWRQRPHVPAGVTV